MRNDVFASLQAHPSVADLAVYPVFLVQNFAAVDSSILK